MNRNWQPSDICPGRFVGKPGSEDRWLIAHEAAAASGRYVLVSLDDGTVSPPATAEAMAVDLSKGGYVPTKKVVGGWG